MELVSVNLARVLWFVRATDLNPRGLNLRNTMFPDLVERYKFSGHPTLEDLATSTKKDSDEFTGGEFKNSKGEVLAVSLSSFDDGLVADSRSSTNDTEEFLKDLAEWATRNYGLRFRTEMIRRIGYLSEVFVQCEHHLTALRPELHTLADKLSTLVSRPNELIPYEPSGFSMLPNTNIATKPAPFIFERALDATFSEQRYFSRAPVPTHAHLNLLNDLEKILSN